jgi:hypothetical protein
MDLRVQQIFEEEMEGDTSFMDGSPSSIFEFLFGTHYSILSIKSKILY